MPACRRCEKPVDVEDSVLCKWCATHEPAACHLCGAELAGEEAEVYRVDWLESLDGRESVEDGRDNDDAGGPWCCDHCRASQ
jgi:hypothetical protein